MQCPNCNFDNAPTANFCENCGQPLPHLCPNCGQAVSAAARFCPNCGFRLLPEQLAATPAVVPRPGIGQASAVSALDALRRATPQPLAQKILAQRDRIEGERKLVTALFADIVGSTALAEAMDPEDWREVVSGAHARVSEAVYRYEGTIAQLLGDGVLAFFGAPLAHEDDAERAVRAAVQILATIREYAAELRQRHLVPGPRVPRPRTTADFSTARDLGADTGLSMPRDLGVAGPRSGTGVSVPPEVGVRDLQMRVGINTGTVVVGTVGNDLHMEYLAIGDTVNLAARMQSAADPDAILISENTYRHVSSLFEVEDRGAIPVKGKADEVQVYRVVGERRGAVRVRGIMGLSSPMVGRQREFSTLMQVVRDLAAGQGAIITVSGEAGLGKSRLIAEWHKAVQLVSTSQPIRWVEGRCLSYGSAAAYHLSIDILRRLIGVDAGVSEEQLHAALRESVELLFGPGEEARDVYPFLAHILGLKLEEEAAMRVKYLDGPALLTRYVAAFKACISALARASPTVIVAEDIHWADPSSVELGLQVLPIAADVPVVFVFVTRPDREVAGWRLVNEARDVPGVSAIELHLSPLTEGDSQQLVSNLLEVAALPEQARRLILSKAEGNPFYVEEVIRMLIDRGGLQREDKGWVVTRDLEETEIPDTLQGVIMARVDRLSADAKHTLQVASVIGRRFPVRVLEMVLKNG